MPLVTRLALIVGLFLFAATSVPAQNDWYKMPGTQPAGSKRRAPEAPRALTNESILSLIKAELSDEVIIRKIIASNCPCASLMLRRMLLRSSHAFLSFATSEFSDCSGAKPTALMP